ncbi:MAG: hypothetical protein HZB43_11080 [candidate division Zixibacteria bacterium]|nr:hypothetical protein [candidate division Zixibacteria bacterium]
MKRWLIFAEGGTAGLFDPLDALRPPYLLRNGAWTVADRWIRLLEPTDIAAYTRLSLAEALADHTAWTVNQTPDGRPDDVWIVTGAPSPRPDLRWDGLHFPVAFTSSRGPHCVMRLDQPAWDRRKFDLTAWLTIAGTGPIPKAPESTLLDEPPFATPDGLWDLVNSLALQIGFDAEIWTKMNGRGEGPDQSRQDSTVLISPEKLWIGRDVQIGPHTVIDASSGPVILDAGVVIEPFTRLEGPAFVGAHTRLVGGKISGGCAFGPGCRLGGEIEASIIQGFANKVHEGYFGHGFMGEWVNLGAMTTNSDLKNNYGSVRVTRLGQTVDTGCLKAGSYLADHTKTAIGTLLPTGSTTGVGVNLLSGGLAPKSIPPFVWGGSGRFTEHRLDRMLDTARAAMARRSVMLKMANRADQLSGGEEKALRALFSASAEPRAAFLQEQNSPSDRD